MSEQKKILVITNRKITKEQILASICESLSNQYILDSMHTQNLITAYKVGLIDIFQFLEAWRLANFTDIKPNHIPDQKKAA